MIFILERNIKIKIEGVKEELLENIVSLRIGL